MDISKIVILKNRHAIRILISEYLVDEQGISTSRSTSVLNINRKQKEEFDYQKLLFRVHNILLLPFIQRNFSITYLSAALNRALTASNICSSFNQLQHSLSFV
jgi:hypothetical protein